MKNILTLLLLITSTITYSQDTIIKNKAYLSYYSFKLKAPIIVKYKLYKGGGDCDRSHFHFKNDGLKNRTATSEDYSHHGYDQGHLCNAEDMAYDCTLDELTFRFWNCYPQTPDLNRGIWHTYENDIRKLSQTDSLIILVGGFYNNTKIGNGVTVPDTCWKVVYSLTKQQFIMSYIFTNTDNPVVTKVDLSTIKDILFNKYKINLNTIMKL